MPHVDRFSPEIGDSDYILPIYDTPRGRKRNNALGLQVENLALSHVSLFAPQQQLAIEIYN